MKRPPVRVRGEPGYTARVRPRPRSIERESSVASLFPPWPEGQCLAPSADGRGPSRARTLHADEKEEPTLRRAGNRHRWQLGTKETSTHHRNAKEPADGIWRKSPLSSAAHGKLNAKANCPHEDRPTGRVCGPWLAKGQIEESLYESRTSTQLSVRVRKRPSFSPQLVPRDL